MAFGFNATNEGAARIAARFAMVVALGIACAGAGAANGTQRLDEFLTGLKSMHADFDQSVFDEDDVLQDSAVGVMYLSRPGRFRWEYSQPMPQLIVGDGAEVWVYDPDLAQVTVRSQSETLGNTPAAVLTSERPVVEAFVVNDLGERDGLALVGLSPRDEESTFSDIRMGFDAAGLAMMELEDNFGQTTRLVFRNASFNTDIDVDLFNFVPPEGADVIRD
ncbi:MAG: outer membrane lipoprotein chaperone LolA [Gammaproteobacteria bacterium]